MALAIEFSPLLKWSIVEGLGERQKEERDRKRKETKRGKRRERKRGKRRERKRREGFS